MDQDGADRAKKAKDGFSHDAPLSGGGEDGKPLTNGVKSIPQLDGIADMPAHNAAPRTASMNGTSSSAPGQVSIPDSLVETWNQLPPELQHFEESYLPLSTLIERVAQQCYNGLEDTIQKMTERPRDEAQNSPVPMVNGAGHHNATNGGIPLSKEDLRKRTLLMTFARDQRDKLIKLMVLTQWSRQVGDVTKLIDIWNWLSNQMRIHEDAATWVGQVKLNMLSMKQSNPDIKTALQVLSSGKAEWMPDLNYLPPKPLSAEQLLKTLRNLNALLAIRLNLHEEQPNHFKYSHIANGRATWVIPGEFEVDLSILEEDPESQFFFIDIRLLFSPAPEIPDIFRSRLELRVNDALRTRGLNGCYDTLHDLILTHKITTFKEQANELARRRWSENIRIIGIHRNLIIQYWTESPGPKNWIELGIMSGRKEPGKPGWRDRPIPHIGIRWFRDGNEVKDIDLMRAVDLKELSMERILETVVKLHTLDLLRHVQNGLDQKDGGTPPLLGEVVRPKTPSDLPTYKTQLGATGTTFTLAVEPVTGNLAIQPVSSLSSRIQQEINQLKNRPSEAAHRVRSLLFSDLQNRVEKLAERRGWNIIRLNLAREAVKATFKQDVGRLIVFRPPGWSQEWVIATTITFSAEAWWVVNLDEAANGRAIREASCVFEPSQLPLKRDSLAHVERFAAATISFLTTRREFKLQKIESFIKTEPSPHTATFAAPRLVLHVLGFNLLGKKIGRGSSTTSWLRLTHVGLERSAGRAVHLIRGTIYPPLNKQLAALLTHTHDDDVAFHKGGNFSVLLRTPFARPFVDPLRKRIMSIDRLRTIAAVLESRGFPCNKMSLNSVTFTYGPDPDPTKPSAPSPNQSSTTAITTNQAAKTPPPVPPLTATVTFTNGDVDLHLASTNPHRRVRHFLVRLLTRPAPPLSGFERFVDALILSLPLLRAFEAIEQRYDKVSDGNGGTMEIQPPFIHAWALDTYRVDYKRPAVTFEVTLRTRRDGVRWFVSEVTAPSTEAVEGKLREALKALYDVRLSQRRGAPGIGEEKSEPWGQDGPGSDDNVWWGLRTGIVATVVGIEDAILKLDDVVRGSISTESDTATAATTTTATVTAGSKGPGGAAPPAPMVSMSKPQPGKPGLGAKQGAVGAGTGVGTAAVKIKQEKKNDVIELD
ncbi:MAG: mediator complex subunit [Bathelium mastoideum]|nr:MAG: mediator complex subunit [Bathelium mastoideum]